MQRQYGGSVSQAHSGAPVDDDNSSVQSIKFYGVNVSSGVKSGQSSRKKNRRCYGCNKKGHLVAKCPDAAGSGGHRQHTREKRRCFGCNVVGHLVAECPKAASVVKSVSADVSGRRVAVPGV